MNFTDRVTFSEQVDAAVSALPGQDRPLIVVIRGLPGIGKRALARWLAKKYHTRFSGGALYVDLAREQTEPNATIGGILRRVGFPADEIPDRLADRVSLFRSWSQRQPLLVAVERAMTASQVRALVPSAPGSLVIVTADRSLTGLGRDHELHDLVLDKLDPAAAAALLTIILGPSDPRPAAEPADFARLLAYCDGLPIALCVLGAMLTEFPERRLSRFAATLAEERDRLARLSGIDDDLSVPASFAAAYQQLAPAARDLYRAIGRHPRTPGFGLPVLVAATGRPRREVEDAVDDLLRASLLDDLGADRYSVHSLVALHARHLTDPSDPTGSTGSTDSAGPSDPSGSTGPTDPSDPADGLATGADAIRDFYRAGAFAAGRAANPGRPFLRDFWPAQPVDDMSTKDGLAWLDAERANLLALAQRTDPDTACLLAVAVWPLLERDKHAHDLAEIIRLGIEAARALAQSDWESLLRTQYGFAHQFRGDLAEAISQLGAALDRAVRVDIRATALEGLALAELPAGHPDAETHLRDNLRLAEQIADPRRIALACLHLAKIAPPAEALALLDRAETGLATETVNRAKVRTWRGIRRAELGERAAAIADLTAAHETMTAEHRIFDRALAAEWLGRLTHERSHLDEALKGYWLRGSATDVARVTAHLAELDPEDESSRADGDD